MKKRIFKQTGSIVILIVIVIGAVLFSENQSKKQDVLSQIITAKRDTITKRQVVSGNIYPVKEIEVKSVIPGVLETYYVQIGDNVRTGDRIAKIKILSEPSQIENAKMNLRIAEIAFEKDRLNYERDKNLFEKHIIPASEFEVSEKSYRTSREQYEYANNQLHLLTEGFIPSSNISNVVIATATGTIIDLPLEEGAAVAERSMFRDGTNVALIAQLDSFLFKGKVVENDVLALRKGTHLTVMPTSISGLKIEANIRKIAPKGYLEQGIMKYDVEAVFALPDSVHVFSGFNATAEFILDERIDVLTLPESCLIFDNDSAFVNLLKDGKFERKHITIGLSDGINIEIVSGLSETDKVNKSKFSVF
jgi:HlyD family secretion protein